MFGGTSQGGTEKTTQKTEKNSNNKLLDIEDILEVSGILECVAISSSRGGLDPGIEPMSPALQMDSLPLSHQGSPA